MLSESVQEWVQAWKLRDMQMVRQEGEAFTLLVRLEKRFGPLPRWVRARLHDASALQLVEWKDRMLVASGLEEVFCRLP